MILRRWDPGIDSKSPIHVVCSPKVDVGKKGKQDRDLTRSSSEDLHGSGLDKGRKRSGRWRKSSILSNWIWIWISVTIKAISQIRRGVSPVDLKTRSRRIVKYLQRNFRNFSSIGIRKVRIQFRASFRFLEISDYVIVGWVEIFGINFQRFGNNGIVVNIVTVFVEERKVLVVEDGMDLDETDNMVHTGKGIEEFENDSQKVSDEEIGEDDRVKEDGVDTIAEEKQGDEAEENDQVAGELVKKQGASKRQFKSTVGAGGSYVLSSQRKALAKEIVLTSWRRRVHQTPNKGHQKPSFMNQVNKTWNNNGFLSLWWFLDVYVKVLYYGEGLAFLVWHHGCVWWPITGLLFTVLNLHWCGKLVDVWELKGIVGNIVNAFGFFALGITYGLSDQYKEHYIAFVTNGGLYLLVAQIFLEHKYFLILIYPFDYLKWCWGNIRQNIGSGLNGLNKSYFQVNGYAKKLYVYFKANHKVGFRNCTYYGSIDILYVRILMIEKRNNGFQWCNGVPHGIDRISHKIDCNFTGFRNLEILRLLGIIKPQSSGSVEQYKQVYI
ncbi:unnamed protein product [Brassica rapa subsp. narinosa]|uniref:(rape) hypothetical protein n=2 Tax=Brassica napus TaxID=3708 RepID=A0A816UMA6_BRANA|nr:unnamed protein product [Brassica napus]